MDFKNSTAYETLDDRLAGSDAHEKAEFISKTYQHLGLAILGFIIVETIFLNTPFIVDIGLSLTKNYLWLVMLGIFMFATNIATKWANSTHDLGKQYAGLALYVIAQAFIFVPLLHIAKTYFPGEALIQKAGLLSLFLFAGITAVGFFSKKDFSFMGKFIMIGSFVAIGFIVVAILFGIDLGLWFSLAMVVLAGGSILYQTSNILHQYQSNQYVAASLALFSSLMLLFWYILDIMMRLSSD